MEKKFKLGVIGAGFMSNAIINGVLKSKNIGNNDILVSDVNELALNKLALLGIEGTTDNNKVYENCEYVLLAIKPQNFNEIEDGSIKCVKKVISIMAGVNKAKIKQKFVGAKVVRCMPNTPVSVEFGAVGVDCSDFDAENDVLFVKNLFSSVAKVVAVEENKLSAVTGVSGSSPAYFYLFVKSLIDAGVKNGLTPLEAENLVVATMRGSAEMIASKGDKEISDLINAVCSKGGTTIEAMKVFESRELSSIVAEAVSACINRANELEDL